MLRDRGYEVDDVAIEESFEDFQSRMHNVKSHNMIMTRPIPGRTNIEVPDEHGNPSQIKEPIFVVFAPDEKLGQDAFKQLVGYMHKWSENNRDPNV